MESQIKSLENAMESETKAIDDQIAKYEEYKEQIQDVADAYENAENVKYALAVTGLNSESEILQCRTDKLNTFKDNYIAIQRAIVDAAWASANEQNKAMASVGTGTTDGGGSIKTGDTSIYEVVYEDGAQSVKAFTNKKDAQNYANAMSDGIPDDEPSYYVKLKKYSKGGVISAKKENELTPIAKRIGEDVIISAKEGERVLTPVQNEMWEKWTDALPNLQSLSSMIKLDIPDYSKIGSMLIKNNVQQPSITIGDIHLHEVQNVPDFAKALQKHLPNISVQYNGKH